mgnify:CR=1 FL=1
MSVVLEPARRGMEGVRDSQRVYARENETGLSLDWLTGEAALYIVLVGVALAARLARLGEWPLLKGELDTALAAWRTLQGSSWRPISYSPLLYDANLLLFGLTHATDAATRLLAALAGTLLVVLPYRARDVLGRMGALAAAALLAFTPTWLVFSRTSDGAIVTAAAATTLLLAAYRYVQRGDPPALHLALFAAAVGLTAGPGIYTLLITALLIVGARLLRQGRDEELARLWALLRKGLTREHLFLFVGILLLLATGLLSNLGGLGATVELAGRWVRELAPAQSGRPWWSTLRALGACELLTVFLALVGCIWGLWKRERLDTLLSIWALVALVLSTLLGHRGPAWMVDLMLPLVILAARGFECLWQYVVPKMTLYDLLAIAVTLVIAAFAFLGLAAYVRTANKDNLLQMLIGWGVLLGTWAFYYLMGERGGVLRVIAAFAILLLLAGSLRATMSAVYQAGRDPRQPLVHRPTSAQVRDLEHLLRTISSRQAGDPLLLDIDYEAALDPWMGWYLRDFERAHAMAWVGGSSQATALITRPRRQEEWPAGYAGQRFRLIEEWPDQILTPREHLRWLIYRDPVGWEEASEIEVWIRLPQGDKE